MRKHTYHHVSPLWRRTLRYLIKVFLPIFARQWGWYNRSCLSNQYALHDLKRTEIPHFAKFTVKVYFVVSVFRAWADQLAKEKQADYHHPSAHENLHGENVFVTQARINQVKLLLVLLQFSFYSVLLFANFFPSDATFRWSAVVNLPGNKSFNKSPSKSFSSAGWRPPKPWLRAEEPDMLKHPLVFLISVHVWRSRQWEVDRDSAKARDWIWRGHLAGLHAISSAERFQSPGKISLEKCVQNRIHERHCKTNIIKRHKRFMG